MKKLKSKNAVTLLFHSNSVKPATVYEPHAITSDRSSRTSAYVNRWRPDHMREVSTIDDLARALKAIAARRPSGSLTTVTAPTTFQPRILPQNWWAHTALKATKELQSGKDQALTAFKVNPKYCRSSPWIFEHILKSLELNGVRTAAQLMASDPKDLVVTRITAMLNKQSRFRGYENKPYLPVKGNPGSLSSHGVERLSARVVAGNLQGFHLAPITGASWWDEARATCVMRKCKYFTNHLF